MSRGCAGRLISVNVGMPRDVPWRGRIVRTGIWKESVQGRCRVTRLNVVGDGQGDREGHGGEQRAVFVYQTGSYRHWEHQLGRRDLVHGQFGENFTVDGLPDDEVCIGDRYRIGTALFEITQPRVTCYRVGIRMDHHRMASLLTVSGRPGFYFRVLEEGEVGAGDAIELISEGPQHMTVTAINALLYTARHPKADLEKALRIPALSPGWRQSFETLSRAPDAGQSGAGNAGLAPTAAANTAAPGFRPMRIVRVVRESEVVRSFELRVVDGARLTTPLPGQYVVLRLHPTGGGMLFRCYSLSGQPSDSVYRISVKVEPNGAAGAYLSAGVSLGDVIDVSEPRGGFTLKAGQGPVVLLSAGIGITPMLAMLHALAAGASDRQTWWLHATRNGQSQVFGREVRGLLDRLVHGRSRIWFSRPAPDDREGVDFDARGRPSVDAIGALGVPLASDFYLCGPSAFISGFTQGLTARATPPAMVHSEMFAGGPPLTPGIVGGSARAPHQPDGPAGAGPLVSFARSGLAVRWRESERSLLELAEACDVPVRWSCRAGVCHNCESGLISGAVSYDPEPLDPPAGGNLLICCTRPREDIVLDI